MDNGAIGFILAIGGFASLATLICAGLDLIDDLMLTSHQSFKMATLELVTGGWGRVCLIVHKEQAHSNGFLIQDDYPPSMSRPQT